MASKTTKKAITPPPSLWYAKIGYFSHDGRYAYNESCLCFLEIRRLGMWAHAHMCVLLYVHVYMHAVARYLWWLSFSADLHCIVWKLELTDSARLGQKPLGILFPCLYRARLIDTWHCNSMGLGFLTSVLFAWKALHPLSQFRYTGLYISKFAFVLLVLINLLLEVYHNTLRRQVS